MSSEADIAVSVRGLSKAYTIRHQQDRHVTLAETIMSRLKHPLQKQQTETFWALRDVNVDIRQGEVVGIIGRNGAGKSTLLKILSRITGPTAGRIDLYGRVGSLLEVGTGFHPELTGRENIFLNGAVLGMTIGEIKRQFDAMVDFAGVEKFLDTPVKRYSSGMYVRLAFAVAAHLNPEILIVDEVLAVGDAEFQQKCLGKMKDVAGQGRTVLFVSHNMAAIHLLCSHGIYLEAGTVAYVGSTEGAVEKYTASFASRESRAADIDRRSGSGEYRFTHASPALPVFTAAEPKRVRFTLQRRRKSLVRMHVSAHIIDEMGIIIAQCDSRLIGVLLDDAEETHGTLELRTPWLKPGKYFVDLFVCAPRIVDHWERACEISVGPVLPYQFSVSSDGLGRGVALSEFAWSVD